MIEINATSPWWPLYVAQVLSNGRAPGAYPPKLEHWMTWHFRFLLRGEGFVPSPALPTDVVLEAA